MPRAAADADRCRGIVAAAWHRLRCRLAARRQARWQAIATLGARELADLGLRPADLQALAAGLFTSDDTRRQR
ncbi:hypothetical protein [Azoarcus olearius]|uniref:hypothetical protein n=1 Tax=Azoarcus sp. (strain BH72) TaxID=418699 RepID=UPI0003024631|nr:hypothetical protein [Azoarcus olearius]